MARIGLLAGEGKLPVVFSRVAKTKGDTVIVFGLKGITDDDIGRYAKKVHWLEWGNLKKALFLVAAERIKKIIMLGKLEKEKFFKSEEQFDDEAKKMLDKIKDKKDYAILNEISKALNKFGVEVIDSTTYLKDLIPAKGTLTRREPTKDELEDIAYGVKVGKLISDFDVGQTLIVKDKTVIAIEAIEGTDTTIRRAGDYAKNGFVVVKVARPNQDMRFDVPLAGLETLETLITAGGKVLALEEKKTLLLDKDQMVALADEKGISIVIV